MHGLASAQRDYDLRLPFEAVLIDTTEYDAERDYRPRAAHVTDNQVEQFIVDLVAADDKEVFLQDAVGLLPGSYRAMPLYMAVAAQWVMDKELVGGMVGPVFWKWAKDCAIEAAK